MAARGQDTCPDTSVFSPNGGDSTSSELTPPKKGEETLTRSRRNKRKMTEPRKRLTDFSIKRFCPESPESPTSVLQSGKESDERHRRTIIRETMAIHESEESPCEPLDLSPPSSRSERGNSSTDMSPSPVLIPGPSTPRGITGTPYFPLVVPNLYRTPLLTTPPGIAGMPGMGIRPPLMTLPLMMMPPPSAAEANRLQAGGVTPGSTSQVITPVPSPSPSAGSDEFRDGASTPKEEASRRSRKNYKNMTRERRVEANARERSRVHTISAAFDTLRHAVPSYSYNQRLSKLAILRIACNYIMALARLADDNHQDESNLSFADCVDLCTRTIQTEGRAKRRH